MDVNIHMEWQSNNKDHVKAAKSIHVDWERTVQLGTYWKSNSPNLSCPAFREAAAPNWLQLHPLGAVGVSSWKGHICSLFPGKTPGLVMELLKFPLAIWPAQTGVVKQDTGFSGGGHGRSHPCTAQSFPSSAQFHPLPTSPRLVPLTNH